MSRSDRSQGVEAFDKDEAYEDDGERDAIHGDGPAPAASLTSIRLTRRRSRAKSPTQIPQRQPEDQFDSRTERPQQDSSGPADPVTAVAPAEPAGSHRPGSIVDYWSRLRGERPYPAPAELDPGLIAASWPNAMLLRRHDGETGLRAAALYKPEANPANLANPANPSDHTLDLSPMVVEWILSLGEQALRGAQPIAEKESFERPRGSICYAACALPLSENGAEVDHVLCYLRVLI